MSSTPATSPLSNVPHTYMHMHTDIQRHTRTRMHTNTDIHGDRHTDTSGHAHTHTRTHTHAQFLSGHFLIFVFLWLTLLSLTPGLLTGSDNAWNILYLLRMSRELKSKRQLNISFPELDLGSAVTPPKDSGLFSSCPAKGHIPCG